MAQPTAEELTTKVECAAHPKAGEVVVQPRGGVRDQTERGHGTAPPCRAPRPPPPRPVDHAATTIDVALTDEEIEARLREIKPAERPIPYQRGVLAKYARLVSSASLGAITH